MVTAGCPLTLMRAFGYWGSFWSHTKRQCWIFRHINIIIFIFLASNVLNLNTTAPRWTSHLNVWIERGRCGWLWVGKGWWNLQLRIECNLWATDWRDLPLRVDMRDSDSNLWCLWLRWMVHLLYMLSSTQSWSEIVIASCKMAGKSQCWTQRMCIENLYVTCIGCSTGHTTGAVYKGTGLSHGFCLDIVVSIYCSIQLILHRKTAGIITQTAYSK